MLNWTRTCTFAVLVWSVSVAVYGAEAAAVAEPGSAGEAPTTVEVRGAAAKPAAAVVAQREMELSRAVAAEEHRHFSIHKFYIPATQGNLQWLTATVRARPEESLVIWKLMRQWQDPARRPGAVGSASE